MVPPAAARAVGQLAVLERLRHRAAVCPREDIRGPAQHRNADNLRRLRRLRDLRTADARNREHRRPRRARSDVRPHSAPRNCRGTGPGRAGRPGPGLAFVEYVHELVSTSLSATRMVSPVDGSAVSSSTRTSGARFATASPRSCCRVTSQRRLGGGTVRHRERPSGGRRAMGAVPPRSGAERQRRLQSIDGVWACRLTATVLTKGVAWGRNGLVVSRQGLESRGKSCYPAVAFVLTETTHVCRRQRPRRA